MGDHIDQVRDPSPTPEFRELFSSHGLRCTQQRMAIYAALSATKSHPTADELYKRVNDQTHAGPLSLATVYNTLEAFSRVGLCRKIPTVRGTVRYDADTSDHIHIRFRDSDRLIDVPAELSQQLFEAVPPNTLRAVEEALGVQISGINIQLVGRQSTTPSRS